ncbi:hypothetical protein [Helicobacter sp. MIT 01-3238]|uniref:hypothetical protein n=1 Tax=Helicobacter sp. MIT 01-3238 TaxID=398627 RepID=UPI000E1F230B|nr:hypothetical protein [Helicobacter sp. MIT 01-3238]RDU51253.1 hypothetical protein CQA40_10725 [Helicobacter sp. MIT 01-3238]
MQTQICKILWIFRFLTKPQYDSTSVITKETSASPRFARNDKKSIHPPKKHISNQKHTNPNSHTNNQIPL